MAGEVDPLQAALQTAFKESPIAPSAFPPKPSDSLLTRQEPDKVSQASAEQTEAESVSDDRWKQEYERQQSTWRTESAIARKNAEANRERWSKIREEEKLDMNSQPMETVQQSITLPASSVTSSASGQLSSTSVVSTEVTVTGDGVLTDSCKKALSSSRAWEEVPSLASSFPSFSFRESSSGSREHPELPPYLPPPKSTSVTLAVFNNTLSRRARILAFASSLAINLLLPFINGVMLGFGEIFAKNVVVGYFGWDIPGSAVGIRTRVRSRN